MSTDESFIMDDRFDDRWRSDIVESYFEHLPTESKLVSLQRRDSSQPSSSITTQNSMLTAPPLEKTDSQWSPMSSGLVTPLDSIGYWSLTPDSRRRSGRFSTDSSGLYGQSNRWSLGTQLSNVSFTELPAQVTDFDDKMSGDKIQEWNTIEKSDFEQDDNNIFHPDDEIILDPKESLEAPIKRASIGTRAPAQEWPIAEPLPKPIPSIEQRLPRLQPLTLPTNPHPPQSKNDRQSHKNSICETPIDTESSYSRRTSSYSFCSDAPVFKYPSYDPASLPKVTNRLSFVESPPEMFNSESSWPLTASTTSTTQSNLWSVVEKALPPTPRSRGVSISAPRREEFPPRARMSANYDSIRTSSLNFADRPASWNPRYDQAVSSGDFDLNLDRAILGTSLARDHRMARREEETSLEEQQQLALESIFNTLKLSEEPSNRSSVTNGSAFRDNRNYTWTNDDAYRNDPRTEYSRNEHPRSSLPPQMKETPLTEAQRQRNVMNRIVNERGLNPSQFDTSPKHARYFVIKSYNEDDVHKSLKFNIWASTEIGNRRLDKAYRESSRSGPIYLFFSVNASGQFCGMARMMSPVDYTTSSSVWTQTDKWKGRMDVRWIFVKDIPNSQLRHIRVWNNENKPVTNSRDTQELPPDAGLAMLRIFCDYPPKTSVILSNLVSAEMKEEMKEDNRTSMQSMDSRRTSLPSIEGNRHTSMDANRLSNLQSVDELGQYNHRQSLQSDEYSRQQPAEVYPQRQSYQSSISTDDMRRQSYQPDMHDYNRDSRDHIRDIRNGPAQIPLNRRNTIGTTGPIGSTNRVVSSATPTSGMRSHDPSFPVGVAPRYHDTSNHRSMLSGFASLGEVYTSHRYPPFHERTTNAHPRYDDEVRYF